MGGSKEERVHPAATFSCTTLSGLQGCRRPSQAPQSVLPHLHHLVIREVLLYERKPWARPAIHTQPPIPRVITTTTARRLAGVIPFPTSGD